MRSSSRGARPSDSSIMLAVCPPTGSAVLVPSSRCTPARPCGAVVSSCVLEQPETHINDTSLNSSYAEQRLVTLVIIVSVSAGMQRVLCKCWCPQRHGLVLASVSPKISFSLRPA